MDIVPILPLAARTLVNKYLNNEQKHTNDSVRKTSKGDKERRGNYFCSKLFLVNIPFMV